MGELTSTNCNTSQIISKVLTAFWSPGTGITSPTSSVNSSNSWVISPAVDRTDLAALATCYRVAFSEYEKQDSPDNETTHISSSNPPFFLFFRDHLLLLRSLPVCLPRSGHSRLGPWDINVPFTPAYVPYNLKGFDGDFWRGSQP